VSNEVVVTIGSECVVPGFPAGIDARFGVLASGINALSVTWSSPFSGGIVSSYTVEAGSQPGLADLGRQVVNRATYGVRFDGVDLPKAYARVRATNSCGVGPNSFEAIALASGGGNCPNPSQPFLVVIVTGSSVSLQWGGYLPGAGVVAYPTFVEVGSAPFAKDVFEGQPHSVLDPRETLTLPPGRYYARTRSVESCGQVSNPSAEITFQIGS
jgi:hypothetical protein